MIQPEPYEKNDEIRNFLIVMDAMKIFVDPSDNTIEEPEVCATILTIFEPIIRRAAVFAQAVGPVFDPNDVIKCMVNEVYPAFLEKEGRELPECPEIPHVNALDKLPMDINRYDVIYRQILIWLYNNHENENIRIAEPPKLKSDMRTVLPVIKSITAWSPTTETHTDEEIIDILIGRRIKNEEKLRQRMEQQRRQVAQGELI